MPCKALDDCWSCLVQLRIPQRAWMVLNRALHVLLLVCINIRSIEGRECLPSKYEEYLKKLHMQQAYLIDGCLQRHVFSAFECAKGVSQIPFDWQWISQRAYLAGHFCLECQMAELPALALVARLLLRGASVALMSQTVAELKVQRLPCVPASINHFRLLRRGVQLAMLPFMHGGCHVPLRWYSFCF